MHHDFKFPRFALLVHRNNEDIVYLVEGRYIDADKGTPVYMMTASVTNMMEKYGAEYVESSFSEHVNKKEEENG